MSDQPSSPTPGTPSTPSMHDVMMAALAQNSERLANAALELKHSFQFSRRMKVTLIASGVVSLLLLAAVAGLVFLALTNRSVLDTIHDCTSTGHACSDRAQQQTAAAVGLIVAEDTRRFELVTVCASSASVVTEQYTDNDRAYLLAIQRCVAKLDAATRPAPRPSPRPASSPSPTRSR